MAGLTNNKKAESFTEQNNKNHESYCSLKCVFGRKQEENNSYDKMPKLRIEQRANAIVKQRFEWIIN